MRPALVFAVVFVALPTFASRANAGTCSVDRTAGVTSAEATAIEDVVCEAVMSEGPWAPDIDHRIDVSRIGARVNLTLRVQRSGFPVDQKQIHFSNMDDAPVAAVELASALAAPKPVIAKAEAKSVSAENARPPAPKKSGPIVHGWLGVIGAGAYAGGTGGGVNVGLSGGSETWSFVSDFRLAGESFNDVASALVEVATLGSMVPKTEADLSYVSLACGARYHFTTFWVSPFVGLGLGLDYIAQNKNVTEYGFNRRRSNDMVGLAGVGELGLDLLRSQALGVAVIVRGDLPTFTLEESAPHPTQRGRTVRTSTYAPVVSAGLTFRF